MQSFNANHHLTNITTTVNETRSSTSTQSLNPAPSVYPDRFWRPTQSPRLSASNPPELEPFGQRPWSIRDSCRVCRWPSCQLRSHKAFSARIANGNSTHPPGHSSITSSESIYTSSYSYRWAEQSASNHVDPDLSAGRIDPFYALPVPEARDLELNRLFHDCPSQRTPPSSHPAPDHPST